MSSLPLQNYSSKDRPLWQPFGTTSATSSFTTASISSLTVSSINGLPPEQIDVSAWAFYPAASNVDVSGNRIINTTRFDAQDRSYFYNSSIQTIQLRPDEVIFPVGITVNGVAAIGSTNTTALSTGTATISTLGVGQVNGVIGNFSTLTASTMTVNELVALSTIEAISTISSSVIEAQAITNLSSINGMSLSTLAGAADWSLYPATSTIRAAGNNIVGVSTLQMDGVFVNGQDITSSATTIFNQNFGENFANLIQTAQTPGAQSSITFLTTGGSANGADYRYVYGTSTVGAIFMRDGNNGIGMVDKAGGIYFFADNVFSASNVSSLAITTSSINGLEFTGAGGGGITLSTVTTAALSTIGASIAQGLMSSIVINPQINPQFNVDLGMGNFLTTLGTGLFGVAVAVPTTAGTITYGLTKGLASLFEPKPVLSNIAITSNFEVYNYQTQLQVSTLGHQVSTIYQFLSTIPSTIIVNSNPTFSTISEIQLPFFFSTISQSANPTCVRSIADPTTTVSTPWTYSQSLPEWGWVELPAGGLSSNVSTLTLSTLALAPSTILSGEPGVGGLLSVLENDGFNFGQVQAQGYNVRNDKGSGTDGIYTGVAGVPYWLDNNFSSIQIALINKNATFSTVNALAGNFSSINNETVQTSTVVGQQISSVAGLIPGYNPNPVFSTVNTQAMIIGSSTVFGNQLTFYTPDLDQPQLVRVQTGDGRTGTILDTQNNGSVYFQSMPSAPGGNVSTSMYLAGLTSAVGIMTSDPQATLDVNGSVACSTITVQGGTNYASPNSVVNVGCSIDGTAEITFQNKSTGSNASAYFFAVENTGNEYAGFGVNSMNLSSIYNTLFELPGASIQSGTLDCVIGPQSDHSSNSGIYLTYQDGANAVHINSNGALSFNASYTSNVLNEGNFGTSNNVLITNGSGAAPSWTSNITLNSVGASSGSFSSVTASNSALLSNATITNLTLESGNLALQQVILSTTTGGPLVATFSNLASPTGIYTIINNLDSTPGLREKSAIYMCGNTSSIGINDIANGFTFDVSGTAQVREALTVPRASISSISTAVAVDALPFAGVSLVAGMNYDAFASPFYGVFDGKQMVQGGYFVQTDASLPAGKGQATFQYPTPLSSIMTIQATYFTNSTAPGLNSIPWVGNGVADGSGRASTIQIYGDSGRDLFVYFMGLV